MPVVEGMGGFVEVPVEKWKIGVMGAWKRTEKVLRKAEREARGGLLRTAAESICAEV